LIFLAFFFFLLFQKKRIKRGKKFERKNVFSGDFDVFASIRRLYGGVSPHINSRVAVKKQPVERISHPPEIGKISFVNFSLDKIMANGKMGYKWEKIFSFLDKKLFL
jgi:hypothetical protein